MTDNIQVFPMLHSSPSIPSKHKSHSQIASSQRPTFPMTPARATWTISRTSQSANPKTLLPRHTSQCHIHPLPATRYRRSILLPHFSMARRKDTHHSIPSSDSSLAITCTQTSRTWVGQTSSLQTEVPMDSARLWRR